MSADARLGSYDLLRPLGRGAMGEVFLARHRELGVEHALKVLSAELAADEESVARFQRELRVLAQVDLHPGLARVHGGGQTPDGRPWYAMEYVPGRSFGVALKEGLGPPEGLLALVELCEALAHLHAQGLVHRDVKPDNVVLGDDGRVRLLDFGLARATQREGARLTRTGDLLGTPAYMAPEQGLGLEQPTAACDVFAVGAMLYELFAGVPPFTGATAIEVFQKLLSGSPPPPLEAHPALTPALRRVIDHALAHDPRERLPDAAALGDALRAALQPAATSSGRPAALLAAAALALAAAGGVWLLSRSGLPATPPRPTASVQQLRPADGPSDDEATWLLQRAEQALLERPGDAARTFAEVARLAPARLEQARAGARLAVLRANDGLLAAWDGDAGELRDCAVAPDGATAYAIAYSGELIAWSLPGGERRVIANLGDASRELALDPSGETLAVSQDTSIHVLSLPTGEVLHTLTGHQSAIRAMDLGARSLLSAGDDGTILLWRREDWQGRILGRHEDRVYGCALEPGHERWAVSACRDGTLRAYDLLALDTAEVILPAKLRGCAFVPSERRVAVVDAQGRAWLWDLTPSPPERVQQWEGDLQAVAAQRSVLGIVDDDGVVRLWDRRAKRETRTWQGHGGDAVYAVSMAPTAGWLVTCGEDGALHVWVSDLEQPALLPELPGFADDPVQAVEAALVR